MKNRCAAVVAVVCLSCIFSVHAQAQEMPKRKAGLWEITISAGKAGQKQAVQQCIDEATDAKMQGMMSGVSQQSCSKQNSHKEGAAFVSESVCKVGSSEISSKAVFTGDFNSNYTGEVLAKYNPAIAGMSESKTTLNAKYVGACKADQKPGDIVMGNGMKMNILDMAQMAGQGAMQGSAH